MSDRRVLVAAVLTLLSLTAAADVYVIRDKSGKIVGYSDQPPPSSATEVRRLIDNRSDTDQLSYEMRRAVDLAPVSLYTSPTCNNICDSARKLLSQRKIPFSEQSVTTQEQLDALKQLVGRDNPQVPVLVVGRQPTEGFAAPTWNNALDTAGYPKASR